ncbi:hypothetical protein BC629DRAFT_1622408 [Irpex lacteus]|nr:hypothetical protein BC629DRAFT_1622408 [Irpex lacteus]
MNAFIRTLLGYDKDPQAQTVQKGGILGQVKGYFGCVEAQGRGSLHCHLVVWVEGGLNPNEIQDRIINGDREFGSRLLAFLDDTIQTSIPPVPSSVPDTSPPGNPCRHRGVFPLPDDVVETARAWDLHHLATQCQLHSHSETCFKYCKQGEPRTCRFDLDPENVRLCSSFDDKTDGMVNNFNATILEAMRCNMDIQFIGSGEGAKAVTYYITNYITKTELKTHVAYAALELAIKRLGEFSPDTIQVDERKPDEDKYMLYAKRLLRRCAHAILTHQEMSGQQVASFLLGHQDCFTSDTFANLYWPSVERYIEGLLPSPECYRARDQKEGSYSSPVDPARDVAGSEDCSLRESTGLVADDEAGDLVPTSNQLCDYLYRPSDFGFQNTELTWTDVPMNSKMMMSNSSPILTTIVSLFMRTRLRKLLV